MTQLMATSTKLLSLQTGKIKTRNFALLLFFSLLALNSCKTDEAATPAASSFTVDKTSGLLATKFNFVVKEVKANSVTLYPYGIAQAAWGTVPITSFTGGVATVTDFQYAYVGTFDAVVVTNNNTTDPNGKVSVKNTVSAVTQITITNNKGKFSKFVVDKSTSRNTPLDTTAKAVADTIPFGVDIKKLKVAFTTDPFAVVTVGATAQTSGETTNDFSNSLTTPVVFNVKSQNGNASTNYSVKVYQTPVEKNTDISSLSGNVTSVHSYGPAPDNKQRKASGYADNTNKKAIFYLPYGSPADYDSIEVSYAVAGKFSVLKYGAEKPALKQGRRLDLSGNKTLVVVPQDSAGTTPSASYTTYAVVAPKLELTFPGLPVPAATTDNYSFNIGINVITGTSLNQVVNSVVTPPAGVLVNATMSTQSTAAGSPIVTFTSGTAVDFSKPVKFILDVTDPIAGNYKVIYLVTITGL